MNHWAVIPSRSRGEHLTNLVKTLTLDGVSVVIIDNGYDPPLSDSDFYVEQPRQVTALRCDQNPPNLSYLWNVGLGYVAASELPNEYVVAVLNDDLRVPCGFVQRLGEELLRTGAAAAYPDQHGWGQTFNHTYPGPISLYRRMTGYAFALRGSAKIKADETLKWWYGDDDIDWTARTRGGSVLVGGVSVEHLRPNETTIGELAEQAGRDRQTFIDKWGRAPW